MGDITLHRFEAALRGWLKRFGLEHYNVQVERRDLPEDVLSTTIVMGAKRWASVAIPFRARLPEDDKDSWGVEGLRRVAKHEALHILWADSGARVVVDTLPQPERLAMIQAEELFVQRLASLGETI